jgi:hypothetical protein
MDGGSIPPISTIGRCRALCQSCTVTSRRAAASCVFVALALVLVGCVIPYPGPTGNPPPEDPITSSRNSPAAPATFRERAELASCGEVVLDQGESTPDDAAACLDAGFASGAELVVVGPTTEGDPVVSYYRVGPAIQGMEIFIDSTLDQWGFGWSHQMCAEATSFIDVGECAEVD